MKSIKIPFQVDGGSIGFTTSQSTAAEQKIKDVLTTVAGERIGTVDYGGLLSGMLFENVDSLVQSDIRNDLIDELRAYVSGVNIVTVDFSPRAGERSVLDVKVLYSLPLGTTQELAFGLAAGTLTEESPL